MFGFITKVSANYTNLAYDYKFDSLNGGEIKLENFKDKVIVVVNVASRCGYTPQYEDLQKLWTKYEKDLVVIGIPTNNFKQEPGSNKEIKKFCEVNFGVNFPMTEKMDVIGKNSHPFYKWAKKNHGIGAIPKWNFHKYLISTDGSVVDWFASTTKPQSKKIISAIEGALSR